MSHEFKQRIRDNARFVLMGVALKKLHAAMALPIRIFFSLCFCTLFSCAVVAQPAPAEDENIPYLVTFGADSDISWGDDDFCQIFFCLIPENHVAPVYLRIYDPDTGGELDEQKGNFNTKVQFSVYGGNGCWSDPGAQRTDLSGNYKSGILIDNQTFGADAKYDKSWYTFGPINPYEGEYIKKFGGRVLKIIAHGLSGDDGNLYRYFLSTEESENIKVEGGNIFTYEYTFRLPDKPDQVSQIYPFIDEKTVSVKISNFDWDHDGEIRVISVEKNGLNCNVSGENNWVSNEFKISEEEKNTSLEIQFIKNETAPVKNNNVVLTVLNQYGVSLPFYVIPIGGKPVYNPKVRMIQSD